jgi:hypothetical protein
MPVQKNLTKSEEKVIVRYILELGERDLPPRLSSVQAFADETLALRGHQPVGKNWVNRFVQRYKELKTHRNRIYNYQRALCEDPELIQKWFGIVKYYKEKHRV